jgi:hypothetical protein
MLRPIDTICYWQNAYPEQLLFAADFLSASHTATLDDLYMRPPRSWTRWGRWAQQRLAHSRGQAKDTEYMRRAKRRPPGQRPMERPEGLARGLRAFTGRLALSVAPPSLRAASPGWKPGLPGAMSPAWVGRHTGVRTYAGYTDGELSGGKPSVRFR